MKIICAYNVNTDAIVQVDDALLFGLVHENQIVLRRKDLRVPPPDAVENIQDLVMALLHSMVNGSGGEWQITKEDLFEKLSLRFRTIAKMELGGNAGIMSRALAEMGVPFILLNTPPISSEQAWLFPLRGIKIPAKMPDGEIVYKDLLTAVDKEAGNIIHFILEYGSGVRISLSDGETITAPESNRCIFSWDPFNREMRTDPLFDEVADMLMKDEEMKGALVSGFHAVPETLSDGRTYVEVTTRAADQLKRWRSSRSDLMVHVELGHFASNDVLIYTLSQLGEAADSIGMNEEEVAVCMEAYGREDLAEIMRSMDYTADVMLAALAIIIGRTGIRSL